MLCFAGSVVPFARLKVYTPESKKCATQYQCVAHGFDDLSLCAANFHMAAHKGGNGEDSAK